MARAKKPSGPTPVEAIKHGDKRVNLPTADAHELGLAPEAEAVVPLLYPRKPELDPQLVWKGKDAQDSAALEVDAPPIWIQEKIDPRVLVENLRRTALAGAREPEATLFDSFDGLGELELVDFYSHEANWSNRMILGDSLQVMASLAEKEALRGKVQMIYIDPPYGIKFGSNWQSSVRRRDVKDGKLEDASREVEQIKAFRDTWADGIHTYLSYLRDRLMVAHELLTYSGSVFVQIGDDNVHLARSLLDEVFGSDNFVTLVTFKKTAGATSEFLAPLSDYIVWYAKDRATLKYNQMYRTKEFGGAGAGAYSVAELRDGSRIRVTTEAPEDARLLRYQTLTSPRVREARTGYFPVTVDGKEFLPTSGEWKTHKEGVARLVLAGRVVRTGNTLSYVRYLDDFAAFPLGNFWEDTQSGSGMDKTYVVQTNTKVVERCLLMATGPGDLVVDPTCGSGTTALVAEEWGRRWITIDTSRVALALARQRLMGARYPYYLLADSEAGRLKEAQVSGTAMPPSVPTDDIRHGFVYERVQHITLKSIANNPDIKEGMSREEIDAAIKRHADFELLYDKPYEDSKRVRVSGPFTVESLSPHRSLAFAAPGEASGMPASEAAADVDPSGADFEQTILANLRTAGVQNGRRKERIEFELLEPYAGMHVHAVGSRRDAPEGTPVRIGISIGPQYGTVGPPFIKDATREAAKAKDIDLLCVLGFAFDPQALGVAGQPVGQTVTTEADFASVAAERRLGRLPVLLVRMNADLVMGTELAKTKNANLFTVFGEPDIDIVSVEGGEVVVKLRGVDVYDPTTGEVRSDSTDRIALWMIDSDYNGESFFVRHCYFTGGHDPYKRLRAALKAEIDEEAWASLYATESRPFARPSSGKIAVKVINDYGDEVLKVFEV